MYFSKEDLYREFTTVYSSSNFSKIPFNSLQLSELKRKNDGFNFLQYGDLFDYLIKPFATNQPQTYDWLIQGEFFYAVKKTTIPFPIMGDITQLGMIVNNQACYIRYDSNPYSHKYSSLYHDHIPLEILESWLYRGDGWNMAEFTIMNIYKSNLPSLLKMPMHSIIKGFEGRGGYALPQYTEFLESKFNHAFKKRYGDERFYDHEKYFELRCLLDTRPNDDWSESGYQLFISSHNQERNVYVVPRADVMGIKKLANPAEAIDSYAAHLFSRAEGEFDFMQYAEDF